MNQAAAKQAVDMIKILRTSARLLEAQRRLFQPEYVPQHILLGLIDVRAKIAYYKGELTRADYYIDDNDIDTNVV